MTFPSGTQISTANVASGSSDPSLARADIYNLITAFNSLVASENTASGVLVLDGSGKITASRLPTSYTSASLTLQPTNGYVSIRNVLRLYQIATDDLGTVTGTTVPQAGDLVYLVDGDRGQPCLSVYNGTAWKIVRLATTVGSAGAAITGRFTLTATATP
jgi:hypothetical protein